jgi:predicted nucleic acid-binding Zn ribbon protein
MVESIYFSKRQAKEAEKLGDVLAVLIESKIAPQQEQFSSVYEIWQQLLPPELCKHCRIDSISNGQLKVLVDSPSYMYQLQLCQTDILAGLKSQCPQFRIARLKFTLG